MRVAPRAPTQSAARPVGEPTTTPPKTTTRADDGFIRPLPSFSVHGYVDGPLGRSGYRKVDTSLDAKRAEATTTTEMGWTNPLSILTLGLIRPTVIAPTTSKATAAASHADVTTLHELGAKHGVIGVLLNDTSASFMFADSPGIFTSGGPTSTRLGAARHEIERAARAVYG